VITLCLKFSFFSFYGLRDFEDVLSEVGGWGSYQISLLALLLPVTLFLSYVAYSPVLLLYAPDHWCAPSPYLNTSLSMENVLKLFIPKEEDGSRSQCKQFDVRIEKVSVDLCDQSGNFNKVIFKSLIISYNKF